MDKWMAKNSNKH